MSVTARLDKQEVYLDYASFSPIDSDVLLAMQPYYDEMYGNPSSMHQMGRNARTSLELMREKIASLMGVEQDELFFTGSGTEANTMAIVGVARASKQYGNHIIVSAIEHVSVLEAVKILEQEGFVVSIAPVLPSGVIDMKACLSLITEQTILISCMYVNNEVGTIEPVEELCERVKEIRKGKYPLVHTDACQVGNLFSLKPSSLGVDLMTLNGTKVYGPSGIGLLYKRTGIPLQPLFVGGEQEGGVRAGTESLPLIAGLATALTKAQEKREEEYRRLLLLRDYFVKGLMEAVPGIIIHGNNKECSPSIVHVTIREVEGESMLLLLDAEGVYVSTGSACASHSITPSHVLVAMGYDETIIHGSLRFSMGKGTTQEALAYVLEVFPSVVKRLRAISSLTQKYETK